jgi:hypothetical protein
VSPSRISLVVLAAVPSGVQIEAQTDVSVEAQTRLAISAHEHTLFGQVLSGLDLMGRILDGDLVENVEILRT